MPELKPCPFCGGVGPSAGRESVTSCAIQCPVEGCRAKVEVDFPEYFPLGCKTLEDVAEFTTEEARKRWNRRSAQR